MYNFFLKVLLIVSVIFLWNSCDNEIDFEINDTLLTFSKDTVYLDTVFTNIGSSTYNLKVYNNSSKNILIPEIKLSNGENSFYRLNVDGIYNQDNDQGKSFENIELLANDSLYIFIEFVFAPFGSLSRNAYLTVGIKPYMPMRFMERRP